MSFNDRPMHLGDLKICRKHAHTDNSVIVPVWITQSNLDGLQALIHVVEGMNRDGKGQLSGSFELVMFYRNLVNCIREAERVAVEEAPDTPAPEQRVAPAAGVNAHGQRDG